MSEDRHIKDVVDEWCENHGYEPSGHNHFHMCEFDLLSGMFDWCSGNKKWGAKNAEKLNRKCREYLKTQGLKRDKYLSCCDYCKHALSVSVYGDAHVYLIQPQTSEEVNERLARFCANWSEQYKLIDNMSSNR